MRDVRRHYLGFSQSVKFVGVNATVGCDATWVAQIAMRRSATFSPVQGINKMRTALVSIACVLLSACASTPDYTQPTSGDTATIIPGADPGYPINGPNLYVFDDDNCGNRRFPPAPFYGDQYPFKVEAGKPLYISRQVIGAGMVTYECAVFETFVPEANATYKIGFKLSFGPVQCSAPVTQVLADGQLRPVADVQVFKPKSCK
jgi:hypothetical protein